LNDIYMPEITYEWKLDFPLIISILSIFISALHWILNRSNIRKKERIRTYEEIYGDTCYILEYPLQRRKNEAKQIQYINENADVQNAVRTYLNSHWRDQAWGSKKFVPSSLIDEDEKRKFVELVRNEAKKFEDKLHSKIFSMTLPERSPVFYLEEPGIKERLNKILNHVGQNLSLFSSDIRKLWKSTRFEDPLEIKSEYEKAISVCAKYFEHNHRGFEDPFFDLLRKLVGEYNTMTHKWTLREFWWKVKHPILFIGSIKKSKRNSFT